MVLLDRIQKYWRDRNTKKSNIAVIGLDRVGKTTIVNALTGRSERKVVPTVGVSKPLHLARSDGLFKIKLFDLGGSRGFRSSWLARIERCHAIIFVFDLSDKSTENRFVEAWEEFQDKVVGHAVETGKPVLIYANKEDSGMMTASDLEELLKLREEGALGGASRRVISCVGAKVHNGDEIDPRLMDGIRWLQDEIEAKWSNLDTSVRIATKDHAGKAAALTANNRKVAKQMKKNKESKTGKNSIVPDQKAAAQTVVICKNKILKGNQRTNCQNEAYKRSSDTGWQAFCKDCWEAAVLTKNAAAAEETEPSRQVANSAEGGVSKLEAFAKQHNAPGPGTGSSSPQAHRHKKERKEKKEKRERKKKSKHRKRDKRPEEESQSPFMPNSLQVGQMIEANFRGKGGWFPGKVAWVNENGTVSVNYDDGDKEDNIAPENVCPLEGPILPDSVRVQVRYRGKTKFFDGTITGVNSDQQTYQVTFDDDDFDGQVQRSWIRVYKR